MPIHDVGYRSWKGKRVPAWRRGRIISVTGFRLALRSRWVRRLMLVCWLPVLYWALVVFFLEQYMARPGLQEGVATVAQAEQAMERIPLDQVPLERLPVPGNQALQQQRQMVEQLKDQFNMLPKLDVLADALQRPGKDTRHTVWSWLLMTLFRYPQAVMLLFLVGFVTPTLISRDVRSRAFLLYFSRPIGLFEYIVGKLAVPAGFIVFVTLLPAIALYLLGLMLSPELSVAAATWDIPLRLVAASVCLVLPLASLSLMLSSLTQESRFATFAWFATWALGHGTWLAVVVTQAIRMEMAPFHRQVLESPLVERWSLISFYNNLGQVQSWIFGFDQFQDVWANVLILVGVTLISLAILFRRVSAPIRI